MYARSDHQHMSVGSSFNLRMMIEKSIQANGSVATIQTTPVVAGASADVDWQFTSSFAGWLADVWALCHQRITKA